MSLFDLFSWVGLAICMGAFFVKDLVLLRILTVIGSSIMLAYYMHISVDLGIVSNVIVALINGFYLLKLTFDRKADVIGVSDISEIE